MQSWNVISDVLKSKHSQSSILSHWWIGGCLRNVSLREDCSVMIYYREPAINHSETAIPQWNITDASTTCFTLFQFIIIKIGFLGYYSYFLLLIIIIVTIKIINYLFYMIMLELDQSYFSFIRLNFMLVPNIGGGVWIRYVLFFNFCSRIITFHYRQLNQGVWGVYFDI